MTNWRKQFCIASINRADLTEFGFTDEQIKTIFTDDVMEEIAVKMQGYYFTRTHCISREYPPLVCSSMSRIRKPKRTRQQFTTEFLA